MTSVDNLSELITLTVRKGATAYSLVEYCHEEHVTVFEIGLHFINGLDPVIERKTQCIDTKLYLNN